MPPLGSFFRTPVRLILKAPRVMSRWIATKVILRAPWDQGTSLVLMPNPSLRKRWVQVLGIFQRRAIFPVLNHQRNLNPIILIRLRCLQPRGDQLQIRSRNWSGLDQAHPSKAKYRRGRLRNLRLQWRIRLSGRPQWSSVMVPSKAASSRFLLVGCSQPQRCCPMHMQWLPTVGRQHLPCHLVLWALGPSQRFHCPKSRARVQSGGASCRLRHRVPQTRWLHQLERSLQPRCPKAVAMPAESTLT